MPVKDLQNFYNLYLTLFWQAVDVMKEVNGNEYRVGCTHCVLYESSGISLDWAHGKVKQFEDVLLILGFDI